MKYELPVTDWMENPDILKEVYEGGKNEKNNNNRNFGNTNHGYNPFYNS